MFYSDHNSIPFQFSDRPLLVITAGGSGGHMIPAVTLAKRWKDLGGTIAWILPLSDQNKRDYGCHEDRICWLKMKRFQNSSSIQKGLIITMMPKLIYQAMRFLKTQKPVAVIGMGGFVTVPAGLAAWLVGVPLILHEANAIPGAANRLLYPFCRKTAVGFETCWPQRQKRHYTGNLLRPELSKLTRHEQAVNRPWHIAVVGGSQGARFLNEHLPAILQQAFGETQVEVIHQTGERDLEQVRSDYQSRGMQASVMVFIEDMAEIYCWADVVISRAGALAVTELLTTGCPGILIPYPVAANLHQHANADYFVSKKGGWQLEQQTDFDQQLISLLKSLDRKQLWQTARPIPEASSGLDLFVNLIQDALSASI